MEEKKTRLFLVRHGEVTTFLEKRNIGQKDVDITPKGLEQMERVGDKLKDETISAVYASDLLRAKKGADIIARYHSVEPNFFPALREISIGVTEGLTHKEIKEKYPEVHLVGREDWINIRVPEGESLKDLETRVMNKFNELLLKEAGKNFVLVGHAGVNNVILCHALNLNIENLFRLEQSYGCLNIVDYFGDMAQVKLVNGIM